MQLKKRVLCLISIMIVVTLGVETIAVAIFYHTAVQEERLRLSELAKSQSHLIESMVRFHKKFDSQYPGGARAATLTQLIDSHNRYEQFSETGELLLAEKQGDKIHFFFGHKQDEVFKPGSVFSGSGLAEPMFLALSGESGSMIGRDYDNEKVIAAYEHVPELEFGVVAKIDLSEIRAPFIRAFVLVLLVGIIAVALGVMLFVRITNPMIRKMSETIEILEDAVKKVKLLSGFLPICASCKKIRDDKGYWNQIESYIKNHSEAEFSHSLCPDCARKLYSKLDI